MPVIVHSQRPLLHTFLPLFLIFSHLALTHIAVNGIRLRLMCIHLSFVIRLPIATEADPFDMETPKVEFSCNVSLPACHGKHRKINKTCLGLKQIRYRYCIRAHLWSRILLLILTFLLLCRLANQNMFRISIL